MCVGVWGWGVGGEWVKTRLGRAPGCVLPGLEGGAVTRSHTCGSQALSITMRTYYQLLLSAQRIAQHGQAGRQAATLQAKACRLRQPSCASTLAPTL